MTDVTVSENNYPVTVNEVTQAVNVAAPLAVVWGNIAGSLANQADLVAALADKSDVGHTHTASEITNFNEALDDRVANLLRAGGNVTLVYDDETGTLTISSSGGGGSENDAHRLSSNDGILNSGGVYNQPWISQSDTGTAVVAGWYKFEGALYLNGLNATSKDLRLDFDGGTATLQNICFDLQARSVNNGGNAGTLQGTFTDITTAQIVAVAASTTGNIYVRVQGHIRFSSSGTFLPTFGFSSGPGTSGNRMTGSYFELKYLGDTSYTGNGW
jgi:hypothetical protein